MKYRKGFECCSNVAMVKLAWVFQQLIQRFPIFSQLFPIIVPDLPSKQLFAVQKNGSGEKHPPVTTIILNQFDASPQKKALCHVALFFASAKYMEFPWETFSTSKFQREKHRVIIDSVWIFHSQRLYKMSVRMAKKHQHGTSNLTPFFSKTSSNFPEPCETNLKIKRNDRQC